jgi:hypothetical protein
MVAIIRQAFIDPSTGGHRIREISIGVEAMRPDETNELSSNVYFNAHPTPLPHGHHPDPATEFAPVYCLDEELLSVLIDGKRTSNSTGCWRTRLDDETKKPWHIYVENPDALNAHIGDPIILMDHFKENTNRVFGLVKAIHEPKHIELLAVDDKTCPHFYRGAIVQNLSNRWTKQFGIIGAKSQLSRPTQPAFAANRVKPQTVHIAIQMPLDMSQSTIYYDIYVRDHPFSEIEVHWVPEIKDLPYSTLETITETFNGGLAAGGGKISAQQQNLYAVVIAKNKSGFENVGESLCSPKPVT